MSDYHPCPYKPGLNCEASPALVKQSKCIDCPFFTQYDLIAIFRPEILATAGGQPA